jgi:hypothetical protein
VTTKDDLVATKPATSEVTTIANDTSELAAKAQQAATELTTIIAKINTIAKDVETYGADCVEVGQALQGFSWIPGAGQGLQAIGGVLILIGKALEKAATEVTTNVKPIAQEIENASKILGEVHGYLGKFAADLILAHKEWEAAGAEFEDIKKECEEGFTKIEQEIEGIVGEIEDAIVSAWHHFISLFEGGHKKHAHKARAADAKANEIKEKLAHHGDKLSDSADTLSGLASPGDAAPAAPGGAAAPAAGGTAPAAPTAAPAPAAPAPAAPAPAASPTAPRTGTAN